MASIKQNSYDITLNKDLFVDPEFKKVKNFSDFFPLKYITINLRPWDKLSSYARLMLIELISLAYKKQSISFNVSAELLQKYRGVTTEMLLSELNDFKYLQCSILKENLENSIFKGNLKKTTRSQKSAPAEAPEILPELSANKTKQFISKYCELFKTKYGSNPVINGKTSGIAKRLSESLGQEKSELYLSAFFAMPDALLHKNKHPLAQFEFKLNEITVFANSGRFTTTKQAFQQDESASNAMLLQQVREGKI